MKSTRVKLKNCWYRVQSWWQIVFGSIRAVNSWRGGNSKDDDTTKTWKEIRLNIKGIREALEEIDRVLKEFLQKKNDPFGDHAAKVKHEFENAISFYHILSLGKFHQKFSPCFTLFIRRAGGQLGTQFQSCSVYKKTNFLKYFLFSLSRCSLAGLSYKYSLWNFCPVFQGNLN